MWTRILNSTQITGIIKYLIRWYGRFTGETPWFYSRLYMFFRGVDAKGEAWTEEQKWTGWREHSGGGREGTTNAETGETMVHVWACSVVSDTLQPMDCGPPGFSVHGVSPGKNAGGGYNFLLKGIFLIQGSNLCLSPVSPELAGGLCTTEAPGKPMAQFRNVKLVYCD